MSDSSCVNDKDLDRISKSLWCSESLGFLCHMNKELGNQADRKTQESHKRNAIFVGRYWKDKLHNWNYFSFYSFGLYWK